MRPMERRPAAIGPCSARHCPTTTPPIPSAILGIATPVMMTPEMLMLRFQVTSSCIRAGLQSGTRVPDRSGKKGRSIRHGHLPCGAPPCAESISAQSRQMSRDCASGEAGSPRRSRRAHDAPGATPRPVQGSKAPTANGARPRRSHSAQRPPDAGPRPASPARAGRHGPGASSGGRCAIPKNARPMTQGTKGESTCIRRCLRPRAGQEARRPDPAHRTHAGRCERADRAGPDALAARRRRGALARRDGVAPRRRRDRPGREAPGRASLLSTTGRGAPSPRATRRPETTVHPPNREALQSERARTARGNRA